ncbi:hypothetical protein P5V15_001475 [Pogonomyrmex californicus]
MATSSIHEASIIRPASAYSGKINPHDLYITSSNGSTLGHGGNNSIPPAFIQMMPYVQPIHSGINPSLPSSQQLYEYYDNSSLPIVMENKLDK